MSLLTKLPEAIRWKSLWTWCELSRRNSTSKIQFWILIKSYATRFLASNYMSFTILDRKWIEHRTVQQLLFPSSALSNVVSQSQSLEWISSASILRSPSLAFSLLHSTAGCETFQLCCYSSHINIVRLEFSEISARLLIEIKYKSQCWTFQWLHIRVLGPTRNNLTSKSLRGICSMRVGHLTIFSRNSICCCRVEWIIKVRPTWSI